MKDFSVLLASPSEKERSVIKTICKSLDRENKVIIYEAKSGAEAIQKMKSQKFNLLISDSELPKILGTSLVQSIIANPKEIKKPKSVLKLLATTPSVKLPKGVNYLSKPILKGQLAYYLDSKLFPQETQERNPQENNISKEDSSLIMEIFGHIAQGAQVTLNDHYEMSATKGEVQYKNINSVSGDISAIITITSKSINGSFALAFSNESFLNVAGEMKDQKFLELSHEIEDLAGDLCESILLKSLPLLTRLDKGVSITDPIVIIGKNHNIRHPLLGPCIKVSFEGEFGNIHLESVMTLKNL